MSEQFTKEDLARAAHWGGVGRYVSLPGFFAYKSRYRFWFRLFGYGIEYSAVGRGTTFSCREGYCGHWHVGRYAFGFLGKGYT